jgi:predicted XRE-type DNA-binding protein
MVIVTEEVKKEILQTIEQTGIKKTKIAEFMGITLPSLSRYLRGNKLSAEKEEILIKWYEENKIK